MKLFVANWKMHKTRAQARAFAHDLGRGIGGGIPGAELVLAPAFTALDAARDERGRWALACQNVAEEPEGAFTGEVSAAMAADAGCRYAIVGHSERRRLFGENGSILARKLARCREAGLTPIYCIGETEEERDAGLTAATLALQLAALGADDASRHLVIAYEPVWAIGAGRSAAPEDCAVARAQVAAVLPARAGLRILYGGSVTAENAAGLLEASEMDGFLIGGASLSAASFQAIARA
ncbi:MAG TPA: triose-phosphate isomerase [Thermoanaerobaculia bacterium]|jgi:triosephosphate isomerase|nr:triose-phosphate isomerase [Thermoanaerobaculia bacterium]